MTNLFIIIPLPLSYIILASVLYLLNGLFTFCIFVHTRSLCGFDPREVKELISKLLLHARLLKLALHGISCDSSERGPHSSPIDFPFSLQSYGLLDSIMFSRNKAVLENIVLNLDRDFSHKLCQICVPLMRLFVNIGDIGLLLYG